MARVSISGTEDPLGKQKDEAEAKMARKVSGALSSQKKRVLAEVEADRAGAGMDSLFWAAEDDAMQAAIVPDLMAMAQAGALGVSAGLPGGVDLGTVGAKAAEWARTYGYDLVRGINGTTQQTLRSALGMYVQTPDMTFNQLVSTLEPTFGPVRAQMIATTEVTRAFGKGSEMARDELDTEGIHTIRIWQTMYDEKVCEICEPLHDQPESAWGGYELPAHPNCRCWDVLELAPEGAR